MAKIEISEKELNALRECNDYLFEEEQTHFNECKKSERANNIFNKVKIIRSWLNNKVIPHYNKTIEQEKQQKELSKTFNKAFSKGLKGVSSDDLDNFFNDDFETGDFVEKMFNSKERTKVKGYYSKEKPKTAEQIQADENLSKIARGKNGKS